MHDLANRPKSQIKKYDPEKGLKFIAVSEAAEKHFARAKDLDNLIKAINEKLEHQAEYVSWWDGQPKQHYGKGSRNGSVTTKAGRNGVPERMVLSRWRKLLSTTQRKLIQSQAVERARVICEFDKTIRGTEGTGENEWFTPKQYLKLARDVLGKIDLDPASSDEAQKVVKAAKYFTRENSGLDVEWYGRVWLNPPYAQPLISQFVSKMVAEVKAAHVSAAIMLTHNYTDTAWFHEAAEACSAICFTRGRVQFYKANGEVAAPTQGQAFFYFGKSKRKFVQLFIDSGFVMVPGGANG